MAFMADHFDRVYGILDGLYPEDIGFLTYETPFQLLISVILSARTTDRQVNGVTGELFRRYPDAVSLASADPGAVEGIIRPVGYFRQKSGYIIRASAVLASRPIPETMEELLEIPGVGRKSANVILGAVFGKPVIIVDTHFARVVYRIGWTDTMNPYRVEGKLKDAIPPQKQYRTSMLLNLHGRTYCYARNPNCNGCPVKNSCPRLLERPD